jgi:hypothetical protein
VTKDKVLGRTEHIVAGVTLNTELPYDVVVDGVTIHAGAKVSVLLSVIGGMLKEKKNVVA